MTGEDQPTVGDRVVIRVYGRGASGSPEPFDAPGTVSRIEHRLYTVALDDRALGERVVGLRDLRRAEA